ncbi:MAG: hypothetical protein QGH39_00890 [Candidatus Thermoplasmatota archaeon]|nr:hypothetical protein [Candidatus Thermoplasmatota archaeon]MDP7264099.1 hypothetical protein [Candidatus Thermoplasmatota archaeon]
MEVSRLMPSKVMAIVGTGNGTDEYPIIRAMGEKYNGPYGLWFPKTSFCRGVKRGLSAFESIIPSFKFCPSNRIFVYILDREYIINESNRKWHRKSPKKKKTIGEMMISRLGKHGIAVIHMQELVPNSSFHFNCKCGPRNFSVYTVVSGEVYKIEEDISRLIKELGGPTLPGDKENLKVYFKQEYNSKRIGWCTAKLIKNATPSQLVSSFKALSSIFCLLEAEFNSS